MAKKNPNKNEHDDKKLTDENKEVVYIKETVTKEVVYSSNEEDLQKQIKNKEQIILPETKSRKKPKTIAENSSKPKTIKKQVKKKSKPVTAKSKTKSFTKKSKTPEDNFVAKPNLFQRTNNWIKLTWQTFTTEVQDRIFMSRKRLMKFFGIILVPILYGVVCVLAFWNPIEGIGKAPMIVMNEDQRVLVAKSFEKDNTDSYVYKVGAVQELDDTSNFLKTINSKLDLTDEAALYQNNVTGTIIVPDQAANTNIKESKLNLELNKYLKDGMKITLSSYDENGRQVITYSPDRERSFSLQTMSMWDLLKSSFLAKTDETIVDTDYKFQTSEISQGISLTNVKYISDSKEINDQWKKSNYYVQMKFPKGYTERMITYIGNMFAYPDNANIKTLTNEINNNKVELWTTFERNFIFGYYMNTISSVLDGIILKSLPNMGNAALGNLLFNNYFVDGATIKSWLGVGREDEDATNNANQIARINDLDSYLISKTTNKVSTNQIKITDEANKKSFERNSLFGNVDDTTLTKPEEVSGIFINFMLNLRALLNNTALVNKLKEVIETLDPNSPVANILKQIEKIIASGNGSSTISEFTDQRIIEINQDIYQLAIGNANIKPSDSVNKINKIWTYLTGSPLLDVKNFNFVTLFGENQTFIEEQPFITNLNNLYTSNPNVFLGATNTTSLFKNIEHNLFLKRTRGLEAGKLYNLDIQGAKYSQYGMGLGQFFLVIGLYIGALMQSFIFDRGKRTAKAKASNYYVSKWLLLVMVGTIQVTLQVWTAYFVGWNQIGAEAMAYIWLWLWFADIIFITIIQGLWFSVKDEAVGKFLAVLIMVFSLAAGGGTFPAFAQFPFFSAIGRLVPFTYVLNGLGEITYGVSIVGTQAYITQFIMTQFGILLIYFFLFFSLGFWVGAKNRVREMQYGSHYGKHVMGAMLALNRNITPFVTETQKKNGKIKYHYHWNKLPGKYDQELYLKVRDMYKFEGQFKWWQKKHHDFVEKPNYSDEDVITRNE